MRGISICDSKAFNIQIMDIDDDYKVSDVVCKYVTENKLKKRDSRKHMFGYKLVSPDGETISELPDDSELEKNKYFILPEPSARSTQYYILAVLIGSFIWALAKEALTTQGVYLGALPTVIIWSACVGIPCGIAKSIAAGRESGNKNILAKYNEIVETKNRPKKVENKVAPKVVQSHSSEVVAEKPLSPSNNKLFFCGKCNKPIPDDSEFCPYCGNEIIKELPKNVCSKCGREIPEDSEFCPYCGNVVTKKPAQIFCRKCGKKIPEDSEFCPYCGVSSNAVATVNISAKSKKKNKSKAKANRPEFLDYEPDNDMVITIVKYASIGLLALFVILYWALAHKMMPGSGTSQLLIYILSALVFTGACAYAGLNMFRKNIFAVNAILGGTAAVFMILMVSFNIAYSYKSVDYITRVDWDRAPIRVSIDANYYSDEIKKVHNASVKMRLGNKGAAWFNSNNVVKVDADEQYDVYLKCGYSKSKVEKNVGLVRIYKNDIINGGTMNYDVKIDDYVSAGVIVYYELDDSFWRVVFS